MALRFTVVSMLVAGSCLSGGAALAQTACSTAVDQLARQHNLALDAPQIGAAGQSATQAAPPATMESRGLTSTQPPPGSTGAFTPPPSGSSSAISPPLGSGSSLPPPGGQRLPPPGGQRLQPPGGQQIAPPQTLAPGAGGAAHSNLTAADRGRMEALLKAARDSDRRGDSQHCQELVREAQATPGAASTGAPR